MTGFEVDNVTDTLTKAKAAGAKVLYGPYKANNKTTAIIKFPGNFISEIHSKEDGSRL